MSRHSEFCLITAIWARRPMRTISRGTSFVPSRTMRLSVALSMLIGLSACIVIPIGVGQESLLSEKQLDFIEIGASTKEQVAAAMSNYLTTSSSGKASVTVTPIKFRNGDWWLYSQTRKEAKWAIIGIDGSLGFGDVDYRFALIKFDSNEVVAELELSSSEGNRCNESGICVGESFRPQLRAPIQDDQIAKQFAIPEDRCGVYVYGVGVPDRHNALWRSLPIWLDGRQVGLIVDGRQYFYWELIPGSHEVAFTNTRGSQRTQLSLGCRAGTAYVLELDKGGKVFWERGRRSKIVLRGSLAGRTAIRRRRLTLTGS